MMGMDYYFWLILNQLDFDNLLDNQEIFLASQAHDYCNYKFVRLLFFVKAIIE